MSKSHRITYLPSLNKSSEPFVVIYSDVWGPVKISTISKARYFVTFIDECTRMTWMSLLHKKVMFLQHFKNFIVWWVLSIRNRFEVGKLIMLWNS